MYLQMYRDQSIMLPHLAYSMLAKVATEGKKNFPTNSIVIFKILNWLQLPSSSNGPYPKKLGFRQKQGGKMA